VVCSPLYGDENPDFVKGGKFDYLSLIISDYPLRRIN
jgi:hypothetical protein